MLNNWKGPIWSLFWIWKTELWRKFYFWIFVVIVVLLAIIFGKGQIEMLLALKSPAFLMQIAPNCGLLAVLLGDGLRFQKTLSLPSFAIKQPGKSLGPFQAWSNCFWIVVAALRHSCSDETALPWGHNFPLGNSSYTEKEIKFMPCQVPWLRQWWEW